MKQIHVTLFCALVLSFFLVPSALAQRGGGGGPMQPSSADCDAKTTSFNSGQVNTRSETCVEVSAGLELFVDASGSSQITSCPGGWNSLFHKLELELCRASDDFCPLGTIVSKNVSSQIAYGEVSVSNTEAYYGTSVHRYQTVQSNPASIENVSTTTSAVGGGS